VQAVREDFLADELRMSRGRSFRLERIEVPRENDDRGATEAKREGRDDREAKDEPRWPFFHVRRLLRVIAPLSRQEPHGGG